MKTPKGLHVAMFAFGNYHNMGATLFVSPSLFQQLPVLEKLKRGKQEVIV